MIVFKIKQDELSSEEYNRWKNYIEENYENNIPMVLPNFFEVFEFENGEEIEYEEE